MATNKKMPRIPKYLLIIVAIILTLSTITVAAISAIKWISTVNYNDRIADAKHDSAMIDFDTYYPTNLPLGYVMDRSDVDHMGYITHSKKVYVDIWLKTLNDENGQVFIYQIKKAPDHSCPWSYSVWISNSKNTSNCDVVGKDKLGNDIRYFRDTSLSTKQKETLEITDIYSVSIADTTISIEQRQYLKKNKEIIHDSDVLTREQIFEVINSLEKTSYEEIVKKRPW